MGYSIEIIELVEREVINDKHEIDFLAKMTDDEIDVYENEVSNIINQESPKLSKKEFAISFKNKMVERNDYYNLVVSDKAKFYR